MPHLVLEYSEPLSPPPDWQAVMTTLADAVARQFLDATGEQEKPTDPREPAKNVGPTPADR